MKTKTTTFVIALTALLMFMLTAITTQSQIQFEGLYSDGMGGAGWNADGSGTEPYGDGHGDIFYYTASRDYVDGADYCGAKLTDVFNGFTMFEQALATNGYTYDQVTLKTALADLGDDVQGIDYFTVDGLHYCNFYPVRMTIELDGESLVEGIGNYSMYISGTNVREFQSGFLKINNISGSSSVAVQNVAAAFLEDMANEELQASIQLSDNVATLSGNGRFGAYTNVVCTFEKGLPEIPFQGLNADHEGFAGWDADGTGLEPYGNGPYTQLYYGASLDYDEIDPDLNACLGHFLDGQKGFLNTLLQLQYRGYEIGDLKCKLGLNSLGPMVEGEDWNDDLFNYYNNVFTFEINNEPILSFLCDTNLLVYDNGWSNITSIGKVYDISENSSADAQFVAQSFMKDLGNHSLRQMSPSIVFGSLFNGNGRDGAKYEILSGKIQAVHEQATFVPAGPVSGTWTLEDSPVYIEGPVTVENGQTLEIEPGVRVATRGTYSITVEGNILAEGTADNPIMFTASNPNITWDGLDYEGQNIVSANPSVFDHCIFQYGQAQGGGEYNSGGIFAVRNYNNLEIYNSTFRHNMADLYSTTYVTCGGAVALWNASPFIQKCIFYDNYALDYAGAILAYMGSEPIISNCLFYNNESPKGGALAYYENSSGVLINNTIVENTSNTGGGLYFYDQSSPEIINTVLWNNSAMSTGNQVFLSSNPGEPGFYYCDIEGGQEGFGGNPFWGDYLFNMDEDPIFENNPDFPYLIGAGSPCINMGTPDTSMWYYSEYLPETCLSGQPRILNDRIEIGAYERLATGIAESVSKDDFMSLRPNPVYQSAIITYELPENSNVKIDIYNYTGQKVFSLTPGKQQQGLVSIPVDFGLLPPGSYICKVTTDKVVQTSKFIKN